MILWEGKMKKYMLLCFLIIIIVIFALIFVMAMAIFPHKKDEGSSVPNEASIPVGEFYLADYEQELKESPPNKNVGSITDAAMAINKGRKLLAEKYGKLDKWEAEVCFDSENNCWLVCSYAPGENVLTAVLCTIIESDGDVMAIWMS